MVHIFLLDFGQKLDRQNIFRKRRYASIRFLNTNFFYVFFNVESEYATDFALSIIVFAQDYGKIIICDLYINLKPQYLLKNLKGETYIFLNDFTRPLK